MRFINKTGYKKIDDAIKIISTVLPEVINSIDPDHKFTCTTLTASEVINNLFHAMVGGDDVEIRSFLKWNPLSKTIAYYSGGNIIMINRWKINKLSANDYAATICHEWCHDLGFVHNGNYATEENLKSVPYTIGRMIKEKTEA